MRFGLHPFSPKCAVNIPFELIDARILIIMDPIDAIKVRHTAHILR